MAEIIILFSILFFVFAIGAIIGSFLNVVILRAFSGESIVLPPSKCPKCNNKLMWWHNIPILSYILLRGKCYFCHEKISIQYPIVEFITGVIFLAVFFKFGVTVDALFAFAIAGLLVVISVTDIKEKVVFDAHTYSLVGIGLVYNLYLTVMEIIGQVNTIVGFHFSWDWILHTPFTVSVLGMILGIVVMLALTMICSVVAGQEAFGIGDTYIMAGLGAVFGWINVPAVMLLAVCVMVVLVLPAFIKSQIVNKNWKILTALLVLTVYTAGYAYLMYKTSLLDNILICTVAMVVFLLIALYTIHVLVRSMRENKSDVMVIPFGPGLTIAGLILLITNFSLHLG